MTEKPNDESRRRISDEDRKRLLEELRDKVSTAEARRKRYLIDEEDVERLGEEKVDKIIEGFQEIEEKTRMHGREGIKPGFYISFCRGIMNPDPNYRRGNNFRTEECGYFILREYKKTDHDELIWNNIKEFRSMEEIKKYMKENGMEMMYTHESVVCQSCGKEEERLFENL